MGWGGEEATTASSLSQCCERSEVLRNLRRNQWAQSQALHTTAGPEETGLERGKAPQSTSKGLEWTIVNSTSHGTVSKAIIAGEISDRVERVWAFPSA